MDFSTGLVVQEEIFKTKEEAMEKAQESLVRITCLLEEIGL